MPLDQLTGEFRTISRDRVRTNYLRDYRFRNPDADVGPGGQPDLDSKTFADGVMPLFAEAEATANATIVTRAQGKWLDEIGQSEIGDKLPATGAGGFVIVEAASGGTTIFAGDEIKLQSKGLRYQCVQTKLYADGELAPVLGFDTGPDTDLPPGTVLKWTSPRPGCASTAVVFEASDGSGLTGGRGPETQDEYRQRIIDARRNPALAGNDAAYIKWVESTPGVGIQKAFVWPAIAGPGTTGFGFTLRPTNAGANRRPSGAQLALAKAWVQSLNPGDDGDLEISLLAQPISVIFQVTWDRRATGWTDSTPWPPYIASDQVVVTSAMATPTVFGVATSTPTDTPQVGQTIALFDKDNTTFVRKRIKTVSVVTPDLEWDLTFDTVNAASDTAFAPSVGAMVSPWSDSLVDLVSPTLEHFDVFGPGEQVASFADPGRRQRRTPEPEPMAWPDTIDNNLATPIQALRTIKSAKLVEPSTPLSTTVGTPGVSSYLIEIDDLAVYPE